MMRLLSLLIACALPATGLAAETVPARAALSADFLAGSAAMEQPVDMAAFAPPPAAGPPLTRFTGSLIFEMAPDAAQSRMLIDRWSIAKADDREYAILPRFDFEFVQVDDGLVPVTRGIVEGSGNWWDWIVGPGRVWSEAGDDGWSRASLPFALIEKNANCMHNGVLSFLFRGEREVSRVAYQISQETCYYFKFDGWGAVHASRDSAVTADVAEVAAAYRSEIARRLPVRPIEELAADYPGLNPKSFGAAVDVTPEHMTLFGVLIKGVNYTGGCETRRGHYPYCDEMLLPSYSLAKTVMAGFSLMRLELLHPGVRRELIVDYVPECREAGDWNGVTFEHLLDMTSGRYQSTVSEADEDAEGTGNFFTSQTHAEKIRLACSRYPRKQPPGKRWVYHTTDTYILGTALAAWWRKQHGAQADFYRELLVDPVWRRLGLSPELATPRHTMGNPAQPFVGWGLVLRRDDIAKLGGFLAIGEGRLGKEALLDTAMVRAALQRDPADTGLRATNEEFRYNNGLWAWNIGGYLGCRDAAWIPFMSGFGGISVVMMPSGIVYYYVSDNYEYRWARAVAEAHRLGPVCRQSSSDG